MTKKRFIWEEKIVGNIVDEFVVDTLNDNRLDEEDMYYLLNELNDENKELKQSYTKLKHRHSLLHDVCIEAECDRDSYQKDVSSLEKENEQLKSFKNDVHDLIDELIKKAEKDVDDLRKDAYEKGYAYNPYYYWGVAHGLEKLKKELKSE